MRKIIVLSFITLDGVMQAPGGPEEDRSGNPRSARSGTIQDVVTCGRVFFDNIIPPILRTEYL